MEHVALGNYILVEPAEDEKVTKGGLILADGKAQADCKRSKIVSISEQLLERFSNNGYHRNIDIGDIVYHAYHIGTPITTHDDRKLTAIHIDNILSFEVE